MKIHPNEALPINCPSHYRPIYPAQIYEASSCSYQGFQNGTDAIVMGNEYILKNEAQTNVAFNENTCEEAKKAEKKAIRKIQNRFACQR